MNIKSPQFKALILALVASALIVLVFMDILNIRTKNQETAELLRAANELIEERILVQSARELMNNAKEDLNALEEVALSDEDLVETIEKIERAGERLGLDTNIVSVEKLGVEESSPSQLISFLVETEGGWNGTFAYLKALESLPNRVVFDEVHFRKEEGLWTARIGFSLYNFK